VKSFTRREFHRRTAAGLFSAAPLAGRAGAAPVRGRQAVREDRIGRRMEDLSRIGGDPAGGYSRTAGSDADLAMRERFSGWLRGAGFRVETDFAGNLRGLRAGREASLPPLLLGSHLDSVPNGGNYDGVAGCVTGLEAVESLDESGAEFRHPLEFFVFFNEENGKTGSRALAGEVTADELDLPLHGGLALGAALRRVGGSPERLAEVKREPGSAAGFLELHIEQGPVLDTGGYQIGAVEGIVGIRRFRVAISGFANHAGTTAMAIRRDALVTAGRFIAAVDEEARALPGRQVATVGRIEAHPGAANVIPGEVELSLEIRDLRMETIESLYRKLQEVGRGLAARNETEIRFEPYYLSRAAPCDPDFIELVVESARAADCSVIRLPSGAGHDAQSIAVFAPIGMIFVPSRGGISHSPREFTRLASIADGARVFAESLRRLDTRV